MTIEPFTAKRSETLMTGVVARQDSPSGSRRVWQDSSVMHDLRDLDGKMAS